MASLKSKAIDSTYNCLNLKTRIQSIWSKISLQKDCKTITKVKYILKGDNRIKRFQGSVSSLIGS
jgi:hypothetical protein